VHAFIDMHDLGDMLVAAGLSAPVMDMELIGIDYRAGERLLDDLRASGQTNARADRSRGLSGRRFLEEFRTAPLRATFEVVYGHAWKRPPVDAAVKTVRVFKRIP
jgi:malonyl-CoA O-methyltransferase